MNKQIIYCPARNAKEAARNVVLAQKRMTSEYLAGRMIDFNIAMKRQMGLVDDALRYFRMGELTNYMGKVRGAVFRRDLIARGELA